MGRLKDIEKILERNRKKYEQTLKEGDMLAQNLMSKDKKELVGIIIGIIMSKGLNNE